MHPLHLLTPWVVFAAIVFPLVYLERWIHRHLYGVGWLLTKNNETATVLYYLILLPGVFVHEFTQWLVAGALNVPTRLVMTWPKTQDRGELRLDFVRVQKTDSFRAAIIGATPLVAGTLLVLFISHNVFDTQSLADAFSTGELPVILAGIQRFFATPDFWLWLYLLFAIGNAMMPNPADREGWPLILGIFGAMAAFLLVIGLGEEVVLPTLQGPVTTLLRVLVTAFTTILILDFFAVLMLALFETVLSQIKGEKANYPHEQKALPAPQPGGEAPLPPDQTPLRIAERRLPLPPPPKRQRGKKQAQPEPTPPAAPPRPSLFAPSQRPSLVEGSPYRPRFRPSDEADLDEEADETETQETESAPEAEDNELEDELRYEPLDDDMI